MRGATNRLVGFRVRSCRGGFARRDLFGGSKPIHREVQEAGSVRPGRRCAFQAGKTGAERSQATAGANHWRHSDQGILEPRENELRHALYRRRRVRACPDWAGMCKHVEAVMYGVGARLDIAPEQPGQRFWWPGFGISRRRSRLPTRRRKGSRLARTLGRLRR